VIGTDQLKSYAAADTVGEFALGQNEPQNACSLTRLGRRKIACYSQKIKGF